MAKLGFESLNDEIFQSEIKAKFKGKIFIGNFKEKRLCEPIKTYRDVISIECGSEIEFSKDLRNFLVEVDKNVKGIYVGVTQNDETAFTIWTELEETAFGKYWFQVKTIKFRFNEIQIKLKTLRPIEDNDKRSYAEKLRATTKTTKDDQKEITEDAMEQWKVLYDFWKREISAFVAWMLSISINRQTITETLRFVSLVIVSLFAGSTQIVKYIGIFVIKLVERTTWLAHVLTPAALGLMDLFSKIIGGLYLLIAMVWKDSIGARRPVPGNAIEAGPRRRQQEAIRYNNNY